ncbi:DUF342 domain-containing protein [Fonticella tunisiensis]|uniref:RNA-binding protein KhpB N-terminal domain-containing protein n=1 Tax=Fonticella tunisiensis TaxID=1096341 RepID=A0A4R7KRL2_9CLOT|nr:FapA family protein [Fonticella tunisiensis]TDT61927.1 hypothetical protein EDD71_105106 [Fonticella tunisiensis]
MLFTAFDIKEAIIKASEFYRCNENELKIHIIKQPYYRFWGIIKKEGIFRIELIQPKTQQKENKRIENGTVEISSGKIKVTDPSPEGKYASIIADDPNIQVYINDKVVEGSAIVTEKDRIEFKAKTIAPSTKIKVDISGDKLKATLTIEKKPGKEYFVKDAGRQNSVHICSDFREIPAPKVTLYQCIEELLKAGVKIQYINVQAINDLINSPNGGSSVVAKGEAPIHGFNSKIKYLFNNSSYRNPDFDTDKQVDLLSHTIIPTVSIGDVLAIKVMPAIPGRDGVAVTGEILKAHHGRDIPLKAGKGTVLLDNDMKIVAISSGRPVLHDGVVSVLPTLTISHDVDVRTGNVHFDGDIVIKGNIMDNIKVEAEGNIIVFGNINQAKVSSKGNIEVHGSIINSKVRAGASVINYLYVLPKMKQVQDIFKEMYTRVKMLQPSQYTEYQLKNIVIDAGRKIIKTTNDLTKLFDLLTDDDIEKVNNILREVKKLLLNTKMPVTKSFEQINTIATLINDYIEEIKGSYDRQANILFKYGQNSCIQANGNIDIIGQGSYQTDLIARNSIIFHKPSSIVRGGMLIAGKRIKMGIVGSPSGISTYCRVLDKDGKIDAAYYYDNTILNFNNNIKIMHDNAFSLTNSENKYKGNENYATNAK